ncbi:hypothetical protein HGA11_22010 [Mycolicibacterium septicum DSM 44393]|uniref:Uncharacterized protein n=1 Tax=Mycolicibacterium septicum DSM 44393 TaxID=1341646 RepID=A0A7X6RYH0_9MYCO|nr:hypothetical protein [Mycolicibacterium septicum]NKZ13656.1 hypothetical protein [Mycolicibacterium septicum DSM 44393]
MMVTATDLGAFLNRTVDVAQANTVIQVVTSLAESYTRGVGFTDHVPNDEIAAVVLGASARVISNAKGLEYQETYGPQSIGFRTAFGSWTVAETFVLNRFRARAA